MWKATRSPLLLFPLLLAPVTLGGLQQTIPAPAAGVWHLLAADEPEKPLPEHRVDFRLQTSATPFAATMINRLTGEDIPLAAATFDGRTLRLTLRGDGSVPQADMGWLQMTWNGTRFDGGYVDKEGKLRAGPAGKLKLIKGVK